MDPIAASGDSGRAGAGGQRRLSFACGVRSVRPGLHLSAY